MPDLQNYQFYDPSPTQAPEPWWQRKRTWQLVGLFVLAAVVLSLAIVAALNALQNTRLAKDEDRLMRQVESVTTRLAAECDEGDAVCLELARADAARSLGVVAACSDLDGEALSTCVTLIAQDKKDPEICKALTGEDRQGCESSAALLQAQASSGIAACEAVSDDALKAACLVQARAAGVSAGQCAEVGVPQAECDAVAAVRAAIAAGDVAACAQFTVDEQRSDCEDGINSLDADGDGLTVGEEVARGLSDGNPDADSDGLKDGDEVYTYTTDPLKADTDGDGFSDGTEVDSGYDPLT